MTKAWMILAVVVFGGAGASEALAAEASRQGAAPPSRSDIRLADGRRMSYLSWGDPSQPVVLALHGKGSSAADLYAVGAALGGRFHVVAPDGRGCGFSDWARDGDYTVEAMVADLEQFVSAQHLERFAVYGASLGAVVAIAYSAKDPAHVSALFLEDGGPVTLPDGSSPALNPGQAERAGTPVPQPVPRRYANWAALQAAEAPRIDPEFAQLVLESHFVRGSDGSVAERTDVVGLWKTVRGEGFTQPWPLVSALQAPTLLVRADHGLLPESIARAMVATNGHIRYETVSNSGHTVRHDQPEAWRRLVAGFFKP